MAQAPSSSYVAGVAIPPRPTTKGDAMESIKSQTWRVVMLLSALASLSLVLMAGRRW